MKSFKLTLIKTWCSILLSILVPLFYVLDSVHVVVLRQLAAFFEGLARLFNKVGLASESCDKFADLIRPNFCIGDSNAMMMLLYRGFLSSPVGITTDIDKQERLYCEMFLTFWRSFLLPIFDCMKALGATSAAYVTSITAQSRYNVIDAFVKDFMQRNSTGQIVILGAGYDTRAFRFADLRRRPVIVDSDGDASASESKEAAVRLAFKFFEVDLPQVQNHKLSVLRSFFTDGCILKYLQEGVEYVACDFQCQGDSLEDIRQSAVVTSLMDKLDPSLPTAILFEGVSMYITQEAFWRTVSSLQYLKDQSLQKLRSKNVGSAQVGSPGGSEGIAFANPEWSIVMNFNCPVVTSNKRSAFAQKMLRLWTVTFGVTMDHTYDKETIVSQYEAHKLKLKNYYSTQDLVDMVTSGVDCAVEYGFAGYYETITEGCFM